MPHTAFYYEHFPGNDVIVVTNDIRTGGNVAKPSFVSELKVHTETFIESYRPSLQLGQYLRRIVQRIFFAYLPQPCVPSQSDSTRADGLVRTWQRA